MKEQLRKNKIALRLLATGFVFMIIASIFLPIFKIEKEIETIEIKEKITVNLSIFDFLSKNDEISVKSNSILGEYDGFLTISMATLLGGENDEINGDNVSIIVAFSLLAMLLPVFAFLLVICFEAWLYGSLQKRTVNCILLSLLSFYGFSILIYFSMSDSGFSVSTPYIFFVIIALIYAISEIIKSICKKIQKISTEIFFKKYKNENIDWFKSFVEDFMEFMYNTNMPIDIDNICQVDDIIDRREAQVENNLNLIDNMENDISLSQEKKEEE